MIREGNSLLIKVGLFLMALALALLIAALVSATLRSKPERVVAAEVARKSPGEPTRYSYGEEGSATKKSSSKKDSSRNPSEEESLAYGSSSGEEEVGKGVGQATQQAGDATQEAGRAAQEVGDGDSQAARSASDVGGQSTEQAGQAGNAAQQATGGTQEDPGQTAAERKAEAKEPQAVLQQEEAERSNSQSEMPQLGSQQTSPEAPSGPQPQSQRYQPHQQQQTLPGAEQRGWSEPTQTELERANQERHYELLPGAIMGLTIEALGIHDAPVFDSKSQWALANGVAHHPQTSLPWSPTAQRNVFLAGHRMGFRGTWSRMIFYNLHKLKRGDEVVLKDRSGTSYRYRVSEVLITDLTHVWVMGQVRGRDMLTLQTCTPIPTFEKRLIVRADRV